MTVETLTNEVVYQGNGSTTMFPVPFKVLDVDHLVVQRRVFATHSVDYTYVGTEFSYDGLGDDAGTLTLDGAALSSTYELAIKRIVPYSQELDLVNAGGFYPETVETQLDLIVMGVQQIAAESEDIAERALMVPIGQTAPSYDDFAQVFKGATGAPGSGNLIGFSADDYLIPDDSSSATVTANNAGMVALTAALAAVGSGVVDFTPGATYWVGGLENQPFVSVPSGVYNWPATVRYLLDLDGLSNVIIRGNGATIKNRAGGKFGSFNTSTGLPRSPDTAPYTSTGAATPYYAMIRVNNCSRVHIEHITLDGNIQNTTKGAQWGDTGIQLQMTGIAFYNNKGPVTTIGVKGINQGLDGESVDENDDATLAFGWSQESCIFTNNGRQGCSLVGGKYLSFDDCTFAYTGVNSGGVASNPGAGVDIEAEGGKKIRHVKFDSCRFTDNVGPGMVADQGDSADVIFKDCVFQRGQGSAGYLLWPKMPRFVFEDCMVLGTLVAAYGSDTSPGDAARFIRTMFSSSGARSTTGTVVCANSDGLTLDPTSSGSNVVFDDCIIEHDNPASLSQLGTDGYRFYNCKVRALQGAISNFGRYSGTRTMFIENGGVINGLPGGKLFGDNLGEAEDYWSYRTGGVTSQFSATIDRATGKKVYYASATYDPPSLAAGAKTTIQTVTVTGAALGDKVTEVSFSNDLAGARLVAWVSATDTVSYYVINENGANPLDLASGTVRVKVVKA